MKPAITDWGKAREAEHYYINTAMLRSVIFQSPWGYISVPCKNL